VAVTLSEVVPETLSDTLSNMEAKQLVDALAATLAEVEAETVGYTLGDLGHLLSSKDTIVQIGHLLRSNGLKFRFYRKSFKTALRRQALLGKL